MNNAIKFISVGVGGLAVGAAASFFVTKKVLSAQYEAILDEEVKKVKEYYSVKRDALLKTGDFETPEKAAAALKLTDLVNRYSTTSVVEDEEGEEGLTLKVTVNGREPNPNDEDEDEDDGPFDPESPYIITEEDYAETHLEYDKQVLTYYEGDDVLTEEGDGTVDEVNSLVGIDSLTKFGKKSGDKNVVYVRNRRLAVDFEIVRKEAAYTQVVLGMKPTKAQKRAAKLLEDGE